MSSSKLSTGAIKRSTILGILIVAVFAVLLLRVLYIQTVNFEKYQQKVIEQMTTKSKVAADRGKIYDKNGNILATNITTYRVFISPSSIKSAQDDLPKGDTRNYYKTVAKGLSEILGVSYDTVYTQATQYTQYLDRTIKRRVDEQTADEVGKFIDENGLQQMIYLEAQSTRYYPYGSLGSHVLGFTNTDGEGLYGIEYQYDEYLRGIDGYYIIARDSYGNEMPLDYASYIDAVPGYNVQTTIDATIQGFLEDQIEKTVTEHNATNRACGIVMDVNTGAILAMATSSKFDLNDPWTLDAASEEKLIASGVKQDSDEYERVQLNLLTSMWSNKAITESYIPGSTFKIITSAMGFEENVVNTNDLCTCSGSLFFGGHKIRCHQVKGHGTLTFAQGLQQSCNVWFMTLGKRIGIENYQKHVEAFGYHEKTGIDLPGEGSGIFASEMTELDLVIYAFGQNFNVTPIQHITAISAVANGGNLLTPYVVEKVTDNAGNTVYEHETAIKRQVVSEDVCKTIAEMLEEGVSGNGGAKNAYVAGYRVAAKTGTSEKKERECPRCGSTGVPKPVEESETTESAEKEDQPIVYVCSICNYTAYMSDFPVSEKYICSTVAYAPADDPEIAIIIVVDEPTKGNLYGSTVAAPYVGDALEAILPYMGVEANYTEKELANMAVRVAGYKGYSVSYAQSLIEARGMKAVVVGNGSVVTSQVPASGTYVEKNGASVVLYTGNEVPEDVVVPDLLGKTAAHANQMLINLGLNVKIEGTPHYLTGNEEIVVVEQSHEKGTKVAKGTVVTITFRYVGKDDESQDFE